MATIMSKRLAALALLALAPCGGCAGFSFEPTAHWWRDGGHICAESRDVAGPDWRRDAPSTCAQADTFAPPLAK